MAGKKLVGVQTEVKTGRRTKFMAIRQSQQQVLNRIGQSGLAMGTATPARNSKSKVAGEKAQHWLPLPCLNTFQSQRACPVSEPRTTVCPPMHAKAHAGDQP